MTEQQSQGQPVPENANTNVEAPEGDVAGRGGRSPYQFTQEDVDKIAGSRAKKAAEVKEREVSEALGVSLDEAKELISKQRQAEEANRTEAEKAIKRAEKAEKQVADLTPVKERADRYEAIVTASVEAQMEALPDDIKDLLSNFDAAGQFEWLTKHGEKYRAGASREPETPTTRRAPDATPTSRSENSQDDSFMNLLRNRGLASG